MEQFSKKFKYDGVFFSAYVFEKVEGWCYTAVSFLLIIYCKLWSFTSLHCKRLAGALEFTYVFYLDWDSIFRKRQAEENRIELKPDTEQVLKNRYRAGNKER